MLFRSQALDYNAVAGAFSLFSNGLEEQFRAFDEREGAALYALSRKASQAEFTSDLHDRIEKALAAMLTMIKKELKRMRDE